ncbi:MAG: hypothetical protein JW776_02710 [Candidatus Lokiarchaeota archaeon]|nr:hypothetical protein [Candidatus Lokiarchaeota archaeon]
MYTNTAVMCEHLPKIEQNKKLNLYHLVGYQALFILLDYSPGKNYDAVIQELCDITPQKLYGKILLHPKNIKELRSQLKSLDKIKDFFISVQSVEKDVLSYAIKDSRVDLITCPHIIQLKSITPGIVSLVKTNQKFIEISLIDALFSKSGERSRLFHEVARFLDTVRNNLHVVLCGGFEQSLNEIRGPREIASIFTAIFDVSTPMSKSIVQSNPQRIIAKLCERKDNNCIQSGVKTQPYTT